MTRLVYSLRATSITAQRITQARVITVEVSYRTFYRSQLTTSAMSLRRSTRVQSVPVTQAALINTKGGNTKKRVRKDVDIDDPSSNTNGLTTDGLAMPPPSTPAKRRRKEDAGKPPPLTPTPSAIGIMLEGRRKQTLSSGDIDDSLSQRSRAVQPHHTNATLITPRGSQVKAQHDDFDTSPSKTSSLPTTSTLLLHACKHLITVDPKLKPLVDRHHCNVFSEEGLNEEIEPFRSLVSGILSQQVSGAAARSIKNKFIALFPEEQCPNGFPQPSIVAVTDLTTLRTAGLSQRKAEYVQGLAQKFASCELSAEMLMNGSDEEVMEKLVAVRGLGVWSVEMFMCFALKRMDIFSTGDLGVQRGMAAYVGKDVAKLKAKGGGKWKYMSEQDMLSISEKFKPYRSLFMWYMWRIEDVETVALEK